MPTPGVKIEYTDDQDEAVGGWTTLEGVSGGREEDGELEVPAAADKAPIERAEE